MRDVQWSETEDGRRWRRLLTHPALSLHAPDGSPGGARYAEEDVAVLDPVVARNTTPESSRFARLWPLLWLIWLPNLIAPVVALFQAHPTPLRVVLVLGGLALFVAVYLWVALQSHLSRAVYPTSPLGTERWRWTPVLVLVVLSVALILGDGPRWLSLLIFTSATAGGLFPLWQALKVLAGLALLTALLGLLSHDTLSDFGPGVFWAGMAGFLVILVSHLRLTNRALHLAREENARLAVEAERLRFARDLHDLLGHDLARIALQSEVVEALVTTAPDRAIATAREMGEAARIALQEVRAAVAGYRQPTLESELRGAGEILSAAGIAYQREGELVALPPAVEAALAWTVREGVTNVVKHSRARHCTVRLIGEADSAGVEVRDDGAGDRHAIATLDDHGGNGLAGLRERVAALGGRCEAGPIPGGFRLAVMLALSTKAGARGAIAERRAEQPAERAGVATGGHP